MLVNPFFYPGLSPFLAGFPIIRNVRAECNEYKGDGERVKAIAGRMGLFVYKDHQN